MLKIPPLPTSPQARSIRKTIVKRVRKSTEIEKKNFQFAGEIALPTLSNPFSICNPEDSKLIRRNSAICRFEKIPKQENEEIGTKLTKERKTQSLKPTKLGSLETLEIEYDIQVHFLTNWGDPNEITVSEIDFLNSQKIPMKVLSVTNISANNKTENIDASEYRKISNGLLIKENEQHKWKHEWFLDHSPIVINFVVLGKRPPDFIRVWNTTETSTRNLKQIAVYFHEKLVARTEVPETLGIIYPLKLDGLPMMPSLEEIYLKHKNVTEDHMTDNYGILPLDSFSTIVLRIFSPFDANSTIVGLNGIEFINEDGTIITENEIESICIQGGNNKQTPFNLFKNDKMTLSERSMWIAERTVNKSLDLIIQLKKQYKIVFVRIWNYNSGKESKEIGASHIGLYMDSKQFSLRRLKSGNGTLQNINESITDIWLTDIKQIRENEKIKKIINDKKYLKI